MPDINEICKVIFCNALYSTLKWYLKLIEWTEQFQGVEKVILMLEI